MKYLISFLVLVVFLLSLFILNTIYPFLPSAANLSGQFGQDITKNWRDFLLGHQSEAKPGLVVSTTTSSYQMDDYLRAEINRLIDERLAELAGTSSANKGYVITPINQNSTTMDGITRSFSDQVVVEPDSSGQSGVIKPIFRDRAGNNYIYVLTPINQ